MLVHLHKRMDGKTLLSQATLLKLHFGILKNQSDKLAELNGYSPDQIYGYSWGMKISLHVSVIDNRQLDLFDG